MGRSGARTLYDHVRHPAKTEHAVDGYVSDPARAARHQGRCRLLQGAVPAHGLRRVIRLTIPQFLAALAVVN